MFDWIILGLWFVLGLVYLFAREEITKFSYACCWLVLMLQLVEKAVW